MAGACGSRATLAREPGPRSSMLRLFLPPLAQALRRVERRRHDRHVAGAAAQMPGEERADVGFTRVRVVAQIIVERHQDAGRAEAALQGVMPAEGLLQQRASPRLWRKTFDGAQGRALRL